MSESLPAPLSDPSGESEPTGNPGCCPANGVPPGGSLSGTKTLDLRPAKTEDAFNYDAIEAIVAWNDPDDEHTRYQLGRWLEDLISNAIREREEWKP